jgi:coenzyme PQQ precursor peptide PqqA
VQRDNGLVSLSIGSGNSAAPSMEDIMAWKTPKIAEVCVGMEINMYACATRK